MSSLHESVIAELKALRRPAWPRIAAIAGVPIPTLEKIVYGHTPNPRIKTVEAIRRALDADQKVPAE